MNKKRNLFLFIIFLIALAILSSCTLFDKPKPEEPKPEVPPRFPEEEFLVEGPDGVEIFIGSGALSQEVEVVIEDLGEGLPFSAPSPLSAASVEYSVDLGGADQIGEITMTVPLASVSKEAAPSGVDLVYLTWTEPKAGNPSVVGTKVENGLATFPLIGAGRYQVFSLKSHLALIEIVNVLEPLAVPTYPQMTPAWCSPTAMTDLVQFHQGAWPAGGLGSAWGESSNWYLAGKTGQAHEEGRFFHQLLSSGGYPAPIDVKQSFSNDVAEVIIWNWIALVDSGFSNPTFANILFNSFQAYVEHFLWGDRGARRPIAFGSSLVAHSRIITGSDGEVFYMNDPSSGALNEEKSWEVYRQEVIASLTAEKIEVSDTVVIFNEPRPDAERRGVIWLLPRNDEGFSGSVALVSGYPAEIKTNWHWDGAMLHIFGYYYQDLTGNLPTDPFLDYQFKAYRYSDRVEFGYAVQNITDDGHDFSVIVDLFNEDMTVSKTVGATDTTVGAGSRKNFFPADSFSIVNLPEGLYTLKFSLFQNGIFQDAKYVHFRLKDTDLETILPHGVLTMPAFCRLGPGTDYPSELVIDANVALQLVGTNPERTWGLFESEINVELIKCWMSYAVVDLSREDEVPVVPIPPLPKKEDSPTKFSCSTYKNQSDCEADARCEWPPTSGPGYCTEK